MYSAAMPLDLGQELINISMDQSILRACDNNMIVGQPTISLEGFISLKLRDNIQIDIGVNNSIRVKWNSSLFVMDCSETVFGFIWENTKLFFDEMGNIHLEAGKRMAKLTSRGISFTSKHRCLVYLLDMSGCKTTTERFHWFNYENINQQFIKDNSALNEQNKARALTNLLKSNYIDGKDQVWEMSGIKIKQKRCGDVHIEKTYSKLNISLSVRGQWVKLLLPRMKVFMSKHKQKNNVEIVLPFKQQRISIENDNFRCKNGSQRAGFDANDQVILNC